MDYETFLGVIGESRVAMAMDIPGFGNSSVPRSEPEIEDYASVIGEVVDEFRFTKVHLFGYHLGTSIAIELARQRPALVQRVIAVSAPVLTIAEREQAARHLEPQRVSADGSHLRALWRDRVRNAMPGLASETIARTFPEQLLNPATRHWGELAASRYSLTDALTDVDKPILILNPHDEYHESTSRVGPYLRHDESRLEQRLDWGNGLLDVKPRDVADVVERFLDE